MCILDAERVAGEEGLRHRRGLYVCVCASNACLCDDLINPVRINALPSFTIGSKTRRGSEKHSLAPRVSERINGPLHHLQGVTLAHGGNEQVRVTQSRGREQVQIYGHSEGHTIIKYIKMLSGRFGVRIQAWSYTPECCCWSANGRATRQHKLVRGL